ncbi:hypothetical protein AZE42_13000 [Rhizopogon vesiculosus]|uniref:Uncharacterized protein n=1 Tax=Rhizopogon vesiculosus TaxID=180088 RepID=A0A1J8Q2B9_9AGAM|nr:hypothetical protein AZE42_13000 [Rhizopogon vesiculosus]
MTLIHLSTLVVIIYFLITTYDAAMIWSVDLFENTRPEWAFPANHVNNAYQGGVVFDEVHEKSDIIMLHELAGKLMEVIQEAKRDELKDSSVRHAKTRYDTTTSKDEAKRVLLVQKVEQDNTGKAWRRDEDSDRDIILL